MNIDRKERHTNARFEPNSIHVFGLEFGGAFEDSNKRLFRRSMKKCYLLENYPQCVLVCITCTRYLMKEDQASAGHESRAKVEAPFRLFVRRHGFIRRSLIHPSRQTLLQMSHPHSGLQFTRSDAKVCFGSFRQDDS